VQHDGRGVFVVNTANPKRTLIPETLVAARYGRHVGTLRRWDEDPELGFPPAIIIRKRKYRDAEALDAWERKRLGATEDAAA
jgi:hypothetical protein